MTGFACSPSKLEIRGDERQMNDREVILLSTGLKFSPTPRDIDKGQLKADLDTLARRIRLKRLFKDNEKGV